MNPFLLKKSSFSSSPDSKKNLEQFLAYMIASEKEVYKNDLIPFKNHAEMIEAKVEDFFAERFSQLKRAQEILKAHFEKLPFIDEESSYQAWERGVKQLQNQLQDPAFTPPFSKTAQEMMSLSWKWMDRAYEIAKKLLEEKNFEEAEQLFFLLKTIQPTVFEYWLGEATCQHTMKKFQQALETYSLSLLLQPSNALLFFQIADCFKHCNEEECYRQALDCCIKYANDSSELQQEAIKLRNTHA